jgi:DNA-binding LacI/PurR family transcriptional regulator
VNAILKMGLVEVVAGELRGRVERGELTGTIPGVRSLAKALGVSVPTMCRALRQLQVEGVLEAGGDRRRWRVSESVGNSGKESSARSPRSGNSETKKFGRLLFIAPHPLSKERHSGVEVFSELLDQLGTSGWEVMYRVVNFWSAKKPRKSWQELLKLTKPDAVVALVGTPVLGNWLKDQRMRTLFLGGSSGDSQVPVVAVRVTTMLQDALDRLTSLGHRSILLPLCGRARGLVQKCHDLVAAHPMGDCVVIAETAYEGPELVLDLLRRQWRERAPDALILLDWREFMAASGFFREADVMIPRDVSVVILSQNANMDWNIPAITHFEHPVNLMARLISKWVVHGGLLPSADPFIEVHARWMERASVAARKP